MGCLKVKARNLDEALERLMSPDNELLDVLIDSIKNDGIKLSRYQAAKLDTSKIEYKEDHVFRINECFYINLKIFIPYKRKKTTRVS